MRTILRTFFFMTAMTCFWQHGSCQKKLEADIDSTTIRNLPDEKKNPFINFPNINKSPYYHQKKELQKIEQYRNSTEIEAWYEALYDYVSNFGIQNFYKDTPLLWEFATLAEKTGRQEEAVELYKLVLKHHRQDIDIRKIQQHFDSIQGNIMAQYVSIDYYYELVDYRKAVDTLQPPRGVLLNMGHLINSRFSDYGPSLNIQDSVLIFTSKRNDYDVAIDVRRNEDLFFAHKDEYGWTEAIPLTEINTIFNEGSACISKDGNTLFFSRCNAPDTYGNCDLFYANRQADGTWGNIQNLGTHINSNAWDSHPSLSHSGDTLYFASDRIGGFGLSDIYFTIKGKKGIWQEAQNAGPYINTRNNEVSPFYHPTYDVLYFSSNGHLLNFGEFDIYKAYRYGRFWGEPTNIGPLVNGEGSEFYFTIDAESKNLFYAKSIENDMANLDLYSFPLPMEAQPDATTLLTGSVIDINTNDPFTNGIVTVIDLEDGIEVAPRRLSARGTFEFNLINNNRYLLIIQSSEFFRIEEFFTLVGNMEINNYTESISSRMEFESIEFDVESAELKTAMFYDLDKVALFLLDNPDFKLRISGHTDSYGTPEYNLDLSKRRASAILEYIVYFGNVARARVESEGYGSTMPIVEEVSEEDRQLNRRVEFEL
ncbi:MAG: OmpA family protein, partial [Cyclobacteriaceae bacterium]|nr:OmpA family protein [Cyclobacteriaceae bacterium]